MATQVEPDNVTAALSDPVTTPANLSFSDLQLDPDRQTQLNHLLLKRKTGLSPDEEKLLQELLAEFAAFHPESPEANLLTNTISETTMLQLLDGFSDTQAVISEITAHVQADSAKRQKIITKLLQIHASITAAKAQQAKLTKHSEAITKSLNPSPKRYETIETTLPQASAIVATTASDVLNPQVSLTPTQQLYFDHLIALGHIQDAEDVIIALAVIAPQPDSPLAAFNQEVKTAIREMDATEQQALVDHPENFDRLNTEKPISENNYRIDLVKIQTAAEKHLTAAETELVKKTELLDQAKNIPAIADLQTTLDKTHHNLNTRLSNTTTDGTFLTVQKDPDLINITNDIVLEANKDHPDQVRFIPNRGVEATHALSVVSPAQGAALRVHTSRVTPQDAARVISRGKVSLKKGVNIYVNLARINKNKIIATENLSTPHTPFSVAVNRVASRFTFGGQAIQAFTHPSRTIGNYFLKQIGQQTGKSFLKGFAHGLVAAEKTTARQIASSLISNIAKMGVKAGIKATATTLAGGAGGAAAGGALGTLAGPLGTVVGIVAGILIEKTFGLVKKGLDKIAIAITGDKVDWRALGALAVSAPLAGLTAAGALTALVTSAIAFTFLAPAAFIIILSAYIFFWIPTINIAPLISTLVHLDSGTGISGTGLASVTGTLPPIEGMGCVQMAATGWGRQAWLEATQDIVLYLNQNHPGFMRKVCRDNKTLIIENWRNEPVGYYGFNPQPGGHIYLRDRLYSSSHLAPAILYTLTHEMAHEVNWRDWNLLNQFQQDVLCQAGESTCDQYLPTYRWGFSPPEDFAETAAWYVTWIRYQSDRYPLQEYPRHWNFAVQRFFEEG